mmetsp:Transcript_16270/g.23859  ORF Transcript_16270/g.23859 Transcript_16270/m.23859 type:complete len:506 (-) Transcript_16270:95-1612(-)
MLSHIVGDCFSFFTIIIVAVSFLTGVAFGFIIEGTKTGTPQKINDDSVNKKPPQKIIDDSVIKKISRGIEVSNYALARKISDRSQRRFSCGPVDYVTQAAMTASDEITLPENDVPKFHYGELEIGIFLSNGRFSEEFEVCKIEQSSNGDANHEQQNGNDDVLEHQYAVKLLSEATMSDRAMLKAGAIELAVETKMLSCINHPNIIKIHGVGDGGLECLSERTARHYFILLDRLNSTLEKRLYSSWKEKQLELERRNMHTMLSKNSARKNQKREFLVERLNVALDIAKALSYLHSRNIIYRDINPENIGFDCYGRVKIFNFGKSRLMCPDESRKDKLCKISGMVGQVRYMAPEMGMRKQYGLPADVYSFSILLWEIISIKKPFETMTKHAHTLLVMKNGDRPSLDFRMSFRIRSLLKCGWSHFPRQRQKITHIIKDLEKEIRKRSVDSNISSGSSFGTKDRRSIVSSSSFFEEEEIYSSLKEKKEEKKNMDDSETTFLMDGKLDKM